jgi:hypothetical protein
MSFSASGDAAFVFKAWSEFLEQANASNASSREPATGGPTIKRNDAPVEPLSVFLERTVKARSNPKIAAAIVLWARRNQQKEEIGPNEVKDLWRMTRHKVPGNVPRELARASQHGWLDRAGGGKYRTTGHGEEFIAS